MYMPDYFKQNNKTFDTWSTYYLMFILVCFPISFYLVFTNDNSLLGEWISIAIGAIAFIWFIALFFVKDKR